MVNKREDPRFWRKWRENGAVGDINGPHPGIAYAFFDTRAPVDNIASIVAAEADRIMGRSPKTRLVTALGETTDIKKEQDPELYDFLQKATIHSVYPNKDQMKDAKPIRLADLKYFLVAQRHGSIDRKAANYLNNILIDIGNEFEYDVPFNAAVIYRNPKDGYLDFVYE